ncbi:MAG: hypothetical protein HRT68_06275 [Flavobacteriaceae bacterium]|nr:hypothetical protein [Flavobacteriaceae bacterium]
MKTNDHIRTLFSRNHETIFPKLGVFLAGPTSPSGSMINDWRRKVIDELLEDEELNSSMVVVAPEPITGEWSEIDIENPETELERVQNQQMLWEIQYLKLCDVTAFWLPTYWTKETSENFSPNIGPTSRWEFGYFLQEYLKDKENRTFIIGSPEDAEGLQWAKRMTAMHGIEWHILKKEDKQQLVASSFINEIKETLIRNKWPYHYPVSS